MRKRIVISVRQGPFSIGGRVPYDVEVDLGIRSWFWSGVTNQKTTFGISGDMTWWTLPIRQPEFAPPKREAERLGHAD